MREFLIQFLAPLCSGVMLIVVLYWFKLPNLLRDNTAAIRQLTARVAELFAEIQHAHEKIEFGEKRHDITQRLIGDIIHHPVDTRRIAEDYSQYPSADTFLRNRKPRRET